MEHDVETGLVVGAHELYGDLHGELVGGELKLTSDGSVPEPELDGSDGEDEFDTGSLRCEARVLPSADQTRFILMGNFVNVPRPVGATVGEAPSTVGFIAHIIAEATPGEVSSPAVRELESSSESESDE